jgi:S-adenosylmethionine:tRNA ribosyltransferase-isomerase
MDVRDFDFDLPPELIAQEPSPERGGSRLLVLHRSSGELEHASFAALPALLQPGDLLVVNNTRVFPARLLGRRVPSGGAVECMLVADLGDDHWEALVHPGQKLKPGAEMIFDGPLTLHGEVLERRFHGRRVVRLWAGGGRSVSDAVDAIGHIPLPPYIKRGDRAEDRDRYQTVFARPRGSVAAPTAGLHFTQGLLTSLRDRGVEVAEITLHVGYGTFQPVRVERVEDHRLEPEQYEIDEAAASALTAALAARRRVVAVGTTTTRTLEAVAARHDGAIVAGRGWADLFIYPGYDFRVVSGLVTNFHLPQSSLLILVSAFAGREAVLGAYRRAVEARYRFYSYGDGMLIL